MVYPRHGGGANRVPLIHREAYSLARGHMLLGVSRVLWAHNTVAVAREEPGVVVEVLSLGQATPLSAYFRKGPRGMPAWPFSSPQLSGPSLAVWLFGTTPQSFYWLWVGSAALLGFAVGRLRSPRIQGGAEGVRQSLPAGCEVCRRAAKAAAAFRLADRRSGGLNGSEGSGCV